jgi:hypothetical protein
MAINTPTQRAGLIRPAMLALASALLVIGFAIGQVTPSAIGALGSAIDSAGTPAVVAPALTRADDYALRHGGSGAVLTRNDDHGLRHPAAAQDTGVWVERAGGR